MKTFKNIKYGNFKTKRNYLIAVLIDIVFGILLLPSKLIRLITGKNRQPDPATARKILVVKLDHIGDVLLTTPAIRAVRNGCSEAEIVCLAGSSGAKVLSGNPDVNRVFTLDVPWYARGSRDTWRRIAGCLLSLRRERFDLCFVFRADPRDIAIGCFSGAEYRAGIGGLGGEALLTHSAAFKPCSAVIEQHKRILEAVGLNMQSRVRPVFHVSEKAADNADSLLGGLKNQTIKFIAGISPAGGVPVMRWSPENWRDTILFLIEEYDAGIVLLGDSAAREELSHRLSQELPPERFLDLAGRTTLEEMAAVVERLNLLVSVDTSIRHFAAAYEVPRVVLQWCGVDAGEWGSYTAEEIVLRERFDCAGCRPDCCIYPAVPCMSNITTGRVMDSVSEVLKPR